MSMIDTIDPPQFEVPYLEHVSLNYPIFYNEELTNCKIDSHIPFLPGCAFRTPTKYLWYGMNKNDYNQTVLFIMAGEL